jgi:hypothetical protein
VGATGDAAPPRGKSGRLGLAPPHGEAVLAAPGEPRLGKHHEVRIGWHFCNRRAANGVECTA